MKALRPEHALVCQLCRSPLAPGVIETARRSFNLMDVAEVISYAEAHRVAATVFLNLIEHLADLIGPVITDELVERRQQARAETLSKVLSAVDTVRRLENAGVEVILLKGPAIGIIGYGDPSLRDFTDVDILIRPCQRDTAVSALLRLGYVRSYSAVEEAYLIGAQHALEFEGGVLKVELHESLLPRHLTVNLNIEDVWRSAIRLTIAGTEIRALDNRTQMIYAVAHGAKHEWNQLRWIADVAQLGGGMRPDEQTQLLAYSQAVRCERLLALGVHLAESMTGEISSGLKQKVIPVDKRLQKSLAVVIRRFAADAVLDVEHAASGLDPRLASVIFWTGARDGLADRVLPYLRIAFGPSANDFGPPWVRWLTRPLRRSAIAASELISLMRARRRVKLGKAG